MRSVPRLVLFFGSFVVLSAALIPAFSLEDLSERSKSIVEGTVLRSWFAWDAKHSHIWTHYEVQVAEWIRGAGGRSIIVSEPGGSLDGLNQQVSGVVHYQPGEHVVLFVYATPIGFLRATGGGQGKLTIAPDGRIRLNLTGLATTGSAGPPGTSPSTWQDQTYDAIKPALRRLAILRPFKDGPR